MGMPAMRNFGKPAAFWQAACRGAVRLRCCQKGVAAVEFALILPVMLLMYFGSAEVTKGILVNRKVTIATRTISDLLAQTQSTPVTDLTIAQIFSAATAVMGPDATGLKMTLSSIKFVLHSGSSTNYDAKTMWSVTTTANSLRPCNVILTKDTSSTLVPDVNSVPAGFYTGAGTLVVADVTYIYPSPFSINASFYSSPGTLTFTRAYFNTPRNTNSIGYSGTSGTTCP